MNTLSIDSSLLLEKSLFDIFESQINTYNVKSVPYWLEDKDGNYKLTLEMPGIDKKDAKFTTQNSILTVKGETDQFKYSSKFYLPKDSDVTKCTISMKNGVAIVTLPRLESQKLRQIEVK